jgi:hypothetical protein
VEIIRSFCPSCEKKKQLLWAEWLRGELLALVSHRHRPPKGSAPKENLAPPGPLRCSAPPPRLRAAGPGVQAQL